MVKKLIAKISLAFKSFKIVRAMILAIAAKKAEIIEIVVKFKNIIQLNYIKYSGIYKGHGNGIYK